MLVLALTAGALTVPAGASAFAKGNGGKSAPLQIRVPEQLAELAALYNSASLPVGVPPRESDGLYIEIAADLNFFGESFAPFQARSSLHLYVNGNGRTLLNFPWELCAGGAKIENLTIRPGPSASRLLYNSAERVYLINSLEALEEMRDRVNRGDYDIRGGIRYAEASYRLTASLVLPAGYQRAGGGWQPIGTEASPFSGSFDGGSRTISNLPISRAARRRACSGMWANPALYAGFS
jgi:hypothetical protein